MLWNNIFPTTWRRFTGVGTVISLSLSTSMFHASSHHPFIPLFLLRVLLWCSIIPKVFDVNKETCLPVYFCPVWHLIGRHLVFTHWYNNLSPGVVGFQTDLINLPGGGGGQRFRRGCAAHFLKPLPYFRPKYAIFPTLFRALPKIRYPISEELLTLFRLRKHLRRASNSQR